MRKGPEKVFIICFLEENGNKKLVFGEFNEFVAKSSVDAMNTAIGKTEFQDNHNPVVGTYYYETVIVEEWRDVEKR